MLYSRGLDLVKVLGANFLPKLLLVLYLVQLGILVDFTDLNAVFEP